MCVCVFTVCVSDICGDQKTALNSLEPELWTVVSQHRGTGTEPRSSRTVASALNHGATPLQLQDLKIQGYLIARTTIMKIKWKVEYELFVYYGNYEKPTNVYGEPKSLLFSGVRRL